MDYELTENQPQVEEKGVLGGEQAAETPKTTEPEQGVSEEPKKEKPKKEIPWEKRYRDTQRAYTKARQEVAALKAEIKALKEKVKPEPSLSAEQKKELEELKYSDPDKWYKKMRELEESAKQELSKSVEQLSEAEKEAVRRELVLEEFLQENPDLTINDDVIANDIPPRIKKELDEGKITFEQFLDKVKDFLTKGKTVDKGKSVPSQPDLNKVGGSTEPTEPQSDDILAKYEELVI